MNNAPHTHKQRERRTINKLHCLGTLSTELSRDNNFAALGLVLHDEAEHTVACTAHGKAAEQLVAQRLALGNGAQATVGDLREGEEIE